MDKNRIGDFYFKRSNGERVLLAKNVDLKGASKILKKFLDDHHYKSYYTRMWEHENELWMDFGSWSEFAVLVYPEKDIIDN